MAPPQLYLERFEGWKTPDFRNWKFGGEGFEFDSLNSERHLGDLTTTFVLNNCLLAKMLHVDGPFFMNNGWINTNKERNVIFIENAFNVANEIFYNNYPKINVPMPHSLCLVKNISKNVLYPAFVMKYIKNDFDKIDENRAEVIRRRRDDMIEYAESRGFDVGLGAHNPTNFIYSEHDDKIYLIGLSLWKKR